MSEKTNIPETTPEPIPEFSPAFVKWLLVLTAGTILLIFFQSPSGDPNEYEIYGEVATTTHLLNPWVIAGGHTIATAIEEFSLGDGFVEISPSKQFATLLGILIAFVIAPTLFLIGWRRFYELQSSGKEPWNFLFKPMGILIIVGGTVTVWIAISSFPVSYLQYDTFQSMIESQTVKENQDYLMADVASVMRASQVYHTLPTSLGGGGGSFEGFSIPDTTQFPHGIVRISHVSRDTVSIEGISNIIPGATVFCTVDSSNLVSLRWTGF
ncbi:MAG: hypothetical protein HYZ34_12445 [Ignavibacteriae bacterium]|nr:hypothetical protein [Ignavibacteriota bacterium]